MTDKILVFDMDGTIADLYGYNNWLKMLKAENTEPYEGAKPLYNVKELNSILTKLKAKGYSIAITTWTSKDGSKEYNKATAKAKREWLDKYSFPYDEFHAVQYGRTKADCTRKYKEAYQILIDDNEKVRAGWHLGATINAKNNIIPELVKLLESEAA